MLCFYNLIDICLDALFLFLLLGMDFHGETTTQKAALRILFTTDFAAPPCLLSLFGGILRQTARMSCMASALDFLLSDIANRVEGRQVPDAFALVRGTVMIRYSAVPSIQYLQTSQTTGRLPAPLSIPGICN